MTIENNEARMTKTGAITTPRGRLSFFGAPAIFRARVFKDEKDVSKAKYQANLLFPKDADISLLRSTVKERVMAMGWSKAEKDKVISADEMFHKNWTDPYLSDICDEFPISIRTSLLASKGPAPEVRTALLDICTDETEVYGGRWARLVVNPWCYSYGGKGVTWDLMLVQLLQHGEQIGRSRPRAEDSFERVELDGDKSAESVF